MGTLDIKRKWLPYLNMIIAANCHWAIKHPVSQLIRRDWLFDKVSIQMLVPDHFLAFLECIARPSRSQEFTAISSVQRYFYLFPVIVIYVLYFQVKCDEHWSRHQTQGWRRVEAREEGTSGRGEDDAAGSLASSLGEHVACQAETMTRVDLFIHCVCLPLCVHACSGMTPCSQDF